MLYGENNQAEGAVHGIKTAKTKSGFLLTDCITSSGCPEDLKEWYFEVDIEVTVGYSFFGLVGNIYVMTVVDTTTSYLMEVGCCPE